MSFGLSREECAQLVAEEGYSLWRSTMVNPERITEWAYASEHEKKRWIEHGRRVMLLVGPSIALEILQDAPTPIPAVHEMGRADAVKLLTADVQHAARNTAYQRGVSTTVEKFTTALKMKIHHVTRDTDGVSRARREAFAEVGEWIDFIAETIMNQKLSLADEETPGA